MSNRQVAALSAYYPQQSSCQIPELWHLYALFLGEREWGQFVEVGAFDGVTNSNTWGLTVRGWQGLLVEPQPDQAAKCRSNHQKHPGVKVVEVAVGAEGEDTVALSQAGTLTTANPALAREYRSIPWSRRAIASSDNLDVKAVPLDSLLKIHEIRPGFDLLSVDVEGYESIVFSTFHITSWRPKIIIVELVETHPDLTTTRRQDALLGQYIIHSGYTVVYKDLVNTVFVRHDIWDKAFRL